jgi:hypothetical protein
MRPKYDVFVSHSPADSENAEKVVAILQQAGLSVWFDDCAGLQELSAELSSQWFPKISEGLDSSATLLVLVGASGIQPYPMLEVSCRPDQRVRRTEFRILPVLLPGARPTNLPLFLRTFLCFDLREWNEDELARLIEALRPSPKVFLCHASEDGLRVKKLHDHLHLLRIDAWLDKTELVLGDVWREEILRAIEQTDFFAVCLSRTAVAKTGFVQNEIRLAIQEYQRRPLGSAYLLPIKLEECEIPRIRLDSNLFMTDLHWLNVFENDLDALMGLSNAIWQQWRKRNSSISLA